MYQSIFKYAQLFERYIQSSEVRRKSDSEISNDLEIEAEIVEDLVSSMHGCFETLKSNLPKIKSLIQNKKRNNLILINRGELSDIRDFAGHLSLLCNMLLNGEEYSEIEKHKAIYDETNKYAQQIDQALESPNVIIQPGAPVINKAVEILKRMDPNYFKGVRKIVVGVSPHYGHVQSGPNQDPSVVNINLNRIVQESGGQTQGPEAIAASAIVIAHEVGHVKSFNPSQGFVGGEGPAEQEENRVRQWIEQNQSRLQDLLK